MRNRGPSGYIKIKMMTLKEFFSGKKVLITGHTGFTGAWIAHLLLNWGTRVSGLSLDPPSNPHLFGILGLDKRMQNYRADVRDYDQLVKIFKKENPEIIFHLAAQAIVRESYDRPLDTFSTNVMGTANVLHAAAKIDGVRALVVATTDKVYENREGAHHPFRERDRLGGWDPYSASKVGADFVAHSYMHSFFRSEDLGRRHSTAVAIVRAGNIIGGGDWGKNRLISDIVRSVYEGDGKVVVRIPHAVRPWQYVLDPIHGYLFLAKELACGNKAAIGAWNFGPDDTNFLTVEEVVKRSLTILGEGKYEIVPDTEKPEEITLTLDASKAKKHLGWRPRYHIDDALRHTLNWYKDFYKGKEIIKTMNEQIESYFDKM